METPIKGSITITTDALTALAYDLLVHCGLDGREADIYASACDDFRKQLGAMAS